MTANVKEPCPACPFVKTVEPGALGGSSIAVYIGQSMGPFMLPCHKHCNFNDPYWKLKIEDTPQCAGAAMFRANIGVADLMPAALHSLPKSDKVFGSAAEFFAHHGRVDIDTAKEMLTLYTPVQMLSDQLARQTNRHIVKKED